MQSESAEYLHEATASPSAEVTLANKLRLLSLDLLYAKSPDADVFIYLSDNGLTRKEYDWFMKGEPPGYQVMGNDYYGKNERIKLPDGRIIEAEDVLGWSQITREYYERYRKPTMHTETNIFDPEKAPTWLWKQWVNILRVRKAGRTGAGIHVVLAHRPDRLGHRTGREEGHRERVRPLRLAAARSGPWRKLIVNCSTPSATSPSCRKARCSR